MTKQAVLYARVSGDDRAKTGGENLQAQLDLCCEYATKKGYTIVAKLTEDDRGASGATFDLPQLSEAIDMARNGEYDVLIVRELDRLARDIGKQYLVETELKKHGVHVEYALYDFSPTYEGKLQKTIYAAFAEFECSKITERMTRGRTRKIKEGNVIVSGRAPYGYRKAIRNGKNTLEIEPQEAAVIRSIYFWYTQDDGADNGPLSLNGIRKRLTADATPTYTDLRPEIRNTAFAKSVRGYGEWSRGAISNILKNEVYTGIWRFGKTGKAIVGSVEIPPIIDKATFEAAQARRSKNRQNSKRNTKFDYLLRGHITCGECRRKMAAITRRNTAGTPFLYYRCNTRYEELPCALGTKVFRAEDVDEAAWAWLVEKFKDTDAWRKAIDEEQEERAQKLLPRQQELEGIEEGITKNRHELEKLLDLYLGSDFPKDILNERKEHIERLLNSLNKRKVHLERLIAEQTLSAERVEFLNNFGNYVITGIAKADKNFAKRRQLIEELELQAVLGIAEGGQYWLELECIVGNTRFEFESTSTCRWSGGTRR